MKPTSAGVLFAWVYMVAVTSACGAEIQLTIAASDAKATNVPVCVIIDLPKELVGATGEDIRAGVTPRGGRRSLPAQVVPLADGKAELWLLLPATNTQPTQWTATLTRGGDKGGERFAFQDAPGAHLDLLFAGKPVLRTMYAFDRSTPARHHETYKVYTHVFDETGKELLTKGSGGLFTHHRGIFIGYSRTKFDGKGNDFWHLKKGEAIKHVKFLTTVGGPVLGRSVERIDWTDTAGKLAIEETRSLTAYRVAAGSILLLDFHTQLKAVNGDVDLGGDPEHAGMQYRPHNDVATANPGKKKPKPGEASGPKATNSLFHTVTADPVKDRDLPWAALSYALRGKRYAVRHMNHPDNPKGTKYSAYRPYGRFGAFASKKLAKGETLELRYRIRVDAGDLPDREKINADYAVFAAPPKASASAVSGRAPSAGWRRATEGSQVREGMEAEGQSQASRRCQIVFQAGTGP